MSDEPETTAGEEPEAVAGEPSLAKPEVKRFRKRFDTARLSPEAAERQGKAARLAWEAFGDRDGMIAFLNTHDDALGGRPIDLAVESVAGLQIVEEALAARPANG